ncbi:RING finger, putative [Pediculus humanus corporis]|uniref:RING finger, putative n=1 Tax=Pediculus humanus subsp. corporis TaxID=121224 RepID=E0W472_PEDHC|nr:RING finger, putative [Pediculus humanus corporis]EEB20428.1 RING finger, putative [Pediculus humanus corporis]
MAQENIYNDNNNGFDDKGDTSDNNKNEKMFTLKKWNAVAMWSWDVECDTCAICRVQVMEQQTKQICFKS